MEDFKNIELSFKEEEINNCIADLRRCYLNSQNNFAQLCFIINNIFEAFKGSYIRGYLKNEYYGFLSAYDLLQQFGFTRKSIERYKNCYKLFIEGNCFDNVYVKTYYVSFTSSKLFELLPLSNTMLVNCIDKQIITPTMTVKEIRQKVKELAGKENLNNSVVENLEETEEISETDNLPEAFDPKKTHTYEYYKQFSKEVLINYLFQFEDYLKKITKGDKK